YVWTALISITLLALAVGYWVGGNLADRNTTRKRFFQLVALAGGLALLVPVLRVPVLLVSLKLGLRAGTLVAAFVLFFPSLAVLGCLSPFAVRLQAKSASASIAPRPRSWKRELERGHVLLDGRGRSSGSSISSASRIGPVHGRGPWCTTSG